MPARFAKMKRDGEKIAALTAYDAAFANTLAQRGVDFMLVGDSMGMTLQGKRDTLAVSLRDIQQHTANVVAGASGAFVVADMPFGSFQREPGAAFANAAKLMAAGADMVKMEGGQWLAPAVRFAAERGIPVCAHVGLTPQTARAEGGFKVRGRGDEGAKQVRDDALAMQNAGAAMIVLELIPANLAADITNALDIPTIGIGSGPGCDGQILVLHDMLGLFPQKRFTRDFLAQAVAKNNGDGKAPGGWIGDAAAEYIRAVKSGEFPAPENSFS